MTDEDLAAKLADLHNKEFGATKGCTVVAIGEFTAVDEGGGEPFTHRVAFKCAKHGGHAPPCGDGSGLVWDSLGRLIRPADERQPPGRTTLGWQVAPLGTARPSSFNELMEQATDAAQIRNPEADG